MKKWIIFGVAAFLCSFALSSFAQHQHKEHAHEEGAVEHEAMPAKTQSVTGEVVDVTCYLAHPDSGIGPDHAKCATDCINKGLPVAIKQGELLFIATGADHQSINKKLAPFAAKNVKATGKIKMRDGLHMIFIQNVELEE